LEFKTWKTEWAAYGFRPKNSVRLRGRETSQPIKPILIPMPRNVVPEFSMIRFNCDSDGEPKVFGVKFSVFRGKAGGG
jgi:hypothetical protein